MRISKPYPHRDGWRCRVTLEPGRYAWATPGRTEAEAAKLAQRVIDAYRSEAKQRVDGLRDAYLDHLRASGIKPVSVRTASTVLGRILAPIESYPVASVTQHVATDAYQQLVRKYSAATHRADLRRAKSLWTWAQRRGLARDNPWALVEPVGRPKRGKDQLRIDEASRLHVECLTDTTDRKLGVLLALHLGLRRSEIGGLNVRDVDQDGQALVIQAGKTAAAARRLDVPDFLQPLLRARTVGKRPESPLLTNVAGKRWDANILGKELRRLCALLGLPRVVPHSLRGLYASAMYSAGTDPHAVARALGHASPAVTRAHYATQQSQVDGAQQQIKRGRERAIKSQP